MNIKVCVLPRTHNTHSLFVDSFCSLFFFLFFFFFALQNTPLEEDALGAPGAQKVVASVDQKVQSGCNFTISFEDHTIGNLLWQQLLEDPDVLFAGERERERGKETKQLVDLCDEPFFFFSFSFFFSFLMFCFFSLQVTSFLILWSTRLL